jgi:YHS domain-containing protein
MVDIVMPTRRKVLIGAAALIAWPLPAAAQSKPLVFVDLVPGVGAGGYDVVQYFEQGKPVVGSAEFTARYEGATWRFVSSKSRDLFAKEPARYAPQYGGYCAWAVSEGYTAKGDPTAWSIVGGKLYLNYNASVQKTWERNTNRSISRGNSNWPIVLTK